MHSRGQPFQSLSYFDLRNIFLNHYERFKMLFLGYRWKVKKDERNYSKIHIIVEKCPHGSYQYGVSDCINACKSKHGDLENIPEWYTVFSNGDNINPTYVYCNYKKGYYNLNGQFRLLYDQRIDHNQCGGNVNVNNPCIEGQIPVPSK